MSILVTFNGTIYACPVNGESGWGPTMTNWITDVSNNAAVKVSPVFSGPVTINSTGGTGFLYVTGNVGNSLPTIGNGLALAFNYSNGGREVDYFNAYGTSAPGASHTFWQRTASSATKLLEIGPTGDVIITGALTLGTLASPIITGGAVFGTVSAVAGIFLEGPTASNRTITFRTAGLNRWTINTTNTAEGGANAGSDFTIGRFSDAGSGIDNPLTITRSTGLTTLASLTVSGGSLTIGTNTQNRDTFINGTAAQTRSMYYQTGGLNRWQIYTSSETETGSNVGSNFGVIACNDAGSNLSVPFSITRSTGVTTLTSLTVTGTTTHSTGVNFGSVGASTTIDLSKHVALFGSAFGFCITANRLNYVVSTGAAHKFVINAVDVASIDLNGMNGTIGATTPAAGTFSAITLTAGGPTWTTGTAAPSATQPVGSTYSRTGAGATLGNTFYVSRGGGTWNPVAGV